MGNSPGVLSKFGRMLLGWRWKITTALFIVILSIQALEHQWIDFSQVDGNIINFPSDGDILHQMIAFGLTLPVSVGIGLSLLAEALKRRSSISGYLDQIQAIGKSAGDPGQWGKLAELLVRFPRSIAPVTGTALWIYDPAASQFWLETRHQFEDPIPPGVQQSFLSGLKCRYAQSGLPRGSPLSECQCRAEAGMPSSMHYYCMPLLLRSLPAGLLQFCLPSDSPLTSEQVHTFCSVAPLLALVIEATRPATSLVFQARAARIERRQIARRLHDTLAQDLALLSGKLEQISYGAAGGEIHVAQDELRQMRSLADHAYHEIRRSLDDLQNDRPVNLRSALDESARLIAGRDHLNVRWTVDEEMEALPPYHKRQVLYILREALTNIEKHSNADQVWISVLQCDDQITVKIADNGQGFSRASVQKKGGHYGLALIAEIAGELGGHCSIDSSIGKGTTITVSIPLPIPSWNSRETNESITGR